MSKGRKRKKGFIGKAKRFIKNQGNSLSQTPLGRAARGKHTRGFI